MKPICVRNQAAPGPLRCLSLTLAGMYYRLTRSLITLSIIGLAVAFLSTVVVEGVVAGNRRETAVAQLRQSRFSGEWLVRLRMADPVGTIVAAFAARDPDRMQEYRKWGELSNDDCARAHELSERLDDFVVGFKKFDHVSRAVLLGDADPLSVPRLLRDGEALALFSAHLERLSLPFPLGGRAPLEAFVSAEYPELMRIVERVQHGQQRALANLEREFAENGIEGALLVSTGECCGVLQREGFVVSAGECELLSRQIAENELRRELTQRIAVGENRRALARLSGVAFDRIDLATVARWARSGERVSQLAAVVYPPDRQGGTPAIDSASLHVLLQTYDRNLALEHMVQGFEGSGGRGWTGLPVRTRWLIIVSFIVCAVGICNTMFMSVTERFSEIATMKCLGALDGFVMMLFVFEAAIQGVIGSVCGAVLGCILALVLGLGTFGMLLFDNYPLREVLTTLLASAGVGIVLAAGAAIAPAWAAARLAPMEAMRVE